jgi:eukaryotic-like serine/threonine-protein kinase
MAVRIETMAEPLPGYRLIERLGGGGFGEVWKAEAPGGLFKAIKFVYGDLEAAGEEGARAGQEFKALKRVITVRHPFILSLERFDIIDGQLMIVTELADRTLWDRFRECRAQGLIGIPRDELLGYLEDTAEALDLMHTQYQLQHLDIKPQNLFLVSNHVKVADFGLVKDLEGMLASVTGGVTPVYAAPETFEGKVSRFSDQYSLAIVYQELLTGQRPYNGQTLRQLVLQHCQGTPDLKPLPEYDRPYVLHALAKKHEERFPSCAEFIQTLRKATLPAVVPGTSPPPAPGAAVSQEKLQGPNADGSKTECRANTRMVPPPLPPHAAPASEAWPQPVARRDEHAFQESPGATPGKSACAETPGQSMPGVATPPPPRKAALSQTDGVLVPALIVGLGQFGMATLRQLRQEISDNFGSANLLPAIRLLYIDADPDSGLRSTRGADHAALRASEVLVARLHRPSYYLKPREGTTGLETWLNPKMLYRMPRQQTPSGIRALGRLAFVDNCKTIIRRLHQELQECCDQKAMERTSAETGLALRGSVPRVYLVANLAGGTGSGMLIDVAYMVQKQLRQLGHESAEVVGLCYLPPAATEPRRAPELANAFAALTELNYFSAPQSIFTARYELGEIRSGAPVFTWKGPPLQRCQFFPVPEMQAAIGEDASGGPAFPPSLAAALARAARCLFTELMTPLGRVAEEQRPRPGQLTAATADRTPGHNGQGSPPCLYQLVGLDRCIWPRRQLLDMAAALICRRIVQRWMSKDSKPVKDAVHQWVLEQWEEHALGAEHIIDRYQQSGEQAVGQRPETVFQTIHQNVVKGLQTHAGKPGDWGLNLTLVVDAMDQYEQLVGIPEEFQPTPGRGDPSTYQPGSLELSLASVAATVVDQYEQKMNVLAVRLIEDPGYRLAGAEEALRQLHTQVEQALLAQEQLAQELKQRAALIYKRIHQMTNSAGNGSQPTTLVWKASGRRTGASPPANIAELQEMLRAYPKVRYQSLIMARVTALYVSLRGQLSDQLREVDFCRARLGELHALFASARTVAGSSGPAAGRYLFADGCKSLDEAVRKLDAGVTASALVELDARMQVLIRKHFKALVHVCMATANVLKTLAPAMQKETRAFLRGRMGEINVAEIFLQQDANRSDAKERLEDELAEGYERAAPEVVASPPAQELNVFAVPPGQGEEQVRELARLAIDKNIVAAPSMDEITIYREHTLGCLADLKQLGPAGQDAYHKMVAREHFTPHCRADIVEWGTRSEQ